MASCLYTYVELNESSPPDDRTASVEHIVPYALGGSDAFTIKYCSKKANNDYGRDIDAPFIALPIVGFKRHSLGLKGNSGTVPSLIFQGECVELKQKCKVVFPFEGAVYVDFGIEVAGNLEVGNLVFSGSEGRLRGAVASLIKKANKKGLAVLGQGLQPFSSFEEAIEAGIKETGETLHFKMDFGREAFFVPWSRGLVKIALGLGARALGSSWAFSPAADILRSCLVCDPADLTNQQVKGTTVGKLPPDVVAMLDVQPGRHTLAVLPHGSGMVAFISLFGGELLDAIIDLGDGPADVSVSNEVLPPTWECVFHIDPGTRKLETMQLSEVNAKLGAGEIKQIAAGDV